MTDQPQDVCRLMAEQLWEWAEVPSSDMSKEVWITQMADALRNHTILPELIGALEEALPALYGDRRQRVVNALALAKGRTP